MKRACAGVVQAAAALRLGWWRFWERASTLLAVSDHTQPVSGEMRLVLSQPLASTVSMSLIGAFRSSIVTPQPFGIDWLGPTGHGLAMSKMRKKRMTPAVQPAFCPLKKWDHSGMTPELK